MDYGTAFSYITQDSDWLKKLAIGALLAFTGIGLIVILGWSVEVTRRVIQGDPEVLPDWSNFGELAMNGVKLLVVGFVWMLPVILVNACLVGAGITAGNQMASQDDAATLLLILNGCGMLLTMVYAIVIGILLAPAAGVLADSGSLRDALSFSNAFNLVRANAGDYITSVLLGGAALMILSSIGSLICMIGVYPAITYGYAVIGHLYGQAYRNAQAKLSVSEAPA